MEDSSEFLNDFIYESAIYLENIDNALLKMEKTEDKKDLINEIFRNFHTIKGLAGFVEQDFIASVAHEIESLLDRIRKGKFVIGKDIFDKIFKVSDYLKVLIDDLETLKNEEFINEIKKFLKENLSEKEMTSKSQEEKIDTKKDPNTDEKKVTYKKEEKQPNNIIELIEKKEKDLPVMELKKNDESKIEYYDNNIETKGTLNSNIQKEPVKNSLEKESVKNNNPKDELNLKITKKSSTDMKYLSFSLDKEYYGISILGVKEIIGMMNINAVPKSPEYVKGVINLRGKILPVVDLRLRFGFVEKEYNERTCILILEIKERYVGIIVDTVYEVINIMDENIEKIGLSELKMGENEKSIIGMGKVKEKVFIILDINQLLV